MSNFQTPRGEFNRPRLDGRGVARADVGLGSDDHDQVGASIRLSGSVGR